MNKASLISIRNLDLAWARITTATNMQHKRMFRHLYQAYEPGRKPNLGLLHEKLHGAWKPTSPIRLYMPKASKLLRPLSLLSLDDQIVLQAIANEVAEQMAARRAAVERNVVFSNCLNPDPRSIFFLQDWRRTYGGFSTRLGRHLMAGNHWIAHFDLAAFYETISHRALQSIVAPSGGSSEVWKLIRDWLCVWTSGAGGIPVDHVVADLIEQHAPAAGMVLAEELVQRDISTQNLRLRVNRIPPETKNVFKGLGLIGATRNTRFDQIGDVIRTRFGLRYWRGWKPLLDANFQHALNLLLNADSKFYSDRSGWLASQNSFNDAVFRAFQKYLADNNLAGAMPLVDGSGQKLRTFGQLLDANAAFAREFTAIATALRAANDRRNRIPDSHPFETKGGKQTKHLQSRERDALKAQLATAYNGIMDFLDAQP